MLRDLRNFVGTIFRAQQGFGIAGQLFKADVAYRKSEVIRGNLFEFVGLIEDDGGSLGQDAGIGCAACLATDGKIGKEEMVVDDDDVGFESLAAHLGDEAALIIGACGAQACVGARVELLPERTRFGQAGEFGTVTGFGLLLPGGNLLELVDLFKAREDWLLFERNELVAAKIVGAALHVANMERSEQRLEKGHVAEVKLVL